MAGLVHAFTSDMEQNVSLDRLVFPLLFFKRISDVHDEEYQAALKEAEGDEEYALFPQNYRFQIPEGCHWRDVRGDTLAEPKLVERDRLMRFDVVLAVSGGVNFVEIGRFENRAEITG